MYFFLALIVTQVMFRYPPLGQARSNWAAWAKVCLRLFPPSILECMLLQLVFQGADHAPDKGIMSPDSGHQPDTSQSIILHLAILI